MDLHMALKSCLEIGSAKTLFTFLQDILQVCKNVFGENSEKVFPTKFWQDFAGLTDQ